MSLVLQKEIERLRELLKEDPDNSTLRQELAKVERDLVEYTPAPSGHNVCESCEG